MLVRICRVAAPLALLLLAMLAPGRASAELLPRPEAVATPEEQPALARLVQLVSSAGTGLADPLGGLDDILASLRQPTPLRGLVQFYRAAGLDRRDQAGAAREAMEESIRLLPSYSGPLLFAAHIDAFGDRPAQAADHFLRAAEIDPEIARNIHDFELGNLVTRLRQRREQRRLQRLAERLFEIGWQGSDLSLRSSLARDLMLARHAEGDIAGTRALIRNLAVPDHARTLLSDLEFEALWPDIERWAGPQQSLQWRLYLSETRARWRASRDPELAVRYVRALDSAGHSGTVIREMLPLFDGRLDPVRDYHLLWVATPVADALARKGRWDEVDALFARALETWPLGSDANALNLAANRARYRLLRGDAAQGLAGLDTAIADAARWGGQVSAAARASMHASRACALHKLGRQAEAFGSIAIAVEGASPGALAEMFLCLDRPDAARGALIEALQAESARQDVIAYVQISDETPVQSGHGRLLKAGADALRADPVLLAAVWRYGRILPYSKRAGAPVEEATPAAPSGAIGG